MTYYELKKYISIELSKANITDNDEEPIDLIEYVTNLKKEDIILKYMDDVPFEIMEKVKKILAERIKGKPLSYINNRAYFYGREFYVNDSVLIPRLDTEVLCEKASMYINENSYVCDLCTGSGCIGITLSLEKNSKVDLIDISNDALDVAKVNIDKYKLGNKVCTFKYDILDNEILKIDKKYDLIVSNPPYIRTDVIQELSSEVKCEPYIALDGGCDGLVFYRRLLEICPKLLKDGGHILFEIGYDQGTDIKKLAYEFGYDCVIYKDYSKNDRVCEVIMK